MSNLKTKKTKKTKTRNFNQEAVHGLRGVILRTIAKHKAEANMSLVSVAHSIKAELAKAKV